MTQLLTFDFLKILHGEYKKKKKFNDGFIKIRIYLKDIEQSYSLKLQLSLLRNFVHVILILICYILWNSCTPRADCYMQCPFQYIVPRIICLPDVSHLKLSNPHDCCRFFLTLQTCFREIGPLLIWALIKELWEKSGLAFCRTFSGPNVLIGLG